MTYTTPSDRGQETDQRSVRKDDFWHLNDINYEAPERHSNSEPKTSRSSTVTVKSLVGIIDTGCDTRHPCLQRCEIEEIDFTAFEQGGTYHDPQNDFGSSKDVDLRRCLELLKIDFKDDTNKPMALIAMLIDDFSKRDLKTCRHTLENPAHRYGRHGVACAGLIAAHEPDNSSLKKFEVPIEDIGFRGIQPGCGLLCISTPFGHDVKPVIRALLYCVARDVDAILIPRGINRQDGELELSANDVVSSEQDTYSTKKSIGKAASASEVAREAEFQALDWLVERVSNYFPVIVASGNNGLHTPEYPADPKWNDVIIVGAHNQDGEISSYTSGRKQTLTLTAPSDDEETHFSNSLRLFDIRAVSALKNTNLATEQPIQIHASSIVSLDTVSQYKPRMTDSAIYGDISVSDSINRKPLVDDPTRGYQLFGGTSAASAIVAGAVAQLQSASRIHRNGRRLSVEQVRHLLTIASSNISGVPRLNLKLAHAELLELPPTGGGIEKSRSPSFG